jgi:hypothetical protein
MAELDTLAPFGARLGSLLEHRGVTAAGVAAAAAVPAAHLDAVLGGGEPGEPLLRRLAPALRLHASDLLLFAARPVPDDLAPAQLDGPWDVGGLAERADARVRAFVAGLPVRPVVRTRPFPADGRAATPGVILLRLLANRNIRLNARLLCVLGAGPYISTSTYWLACVGRLPLRADQVRAIVHTAGLAPGDAAALLGLPVDGPPWTGPTGPAELAWAARRLDDRQILQVRAYLSGERPPRLVE